MPADLNPQDAPLETTVDTFLGQTIGGKYRIVKLLGEGGMGAVYIGEQMLGTTIRKVAIKTLHKHLSSDPAVKARFDREAGTIASLEHPNTIQVFDFGTTDDGTLYLVMELVQGKSVGELLEKEGPMLPERVQNIFAQICGSLEEAHGHGIVHRDLKPDNIVLCEKAGRKDWVEVLEFGIAKRSNEHDAKEAKLTQQGMVLGTPPYMSPEQFTGQPLDARSDIYALGVMAYEMLTAKLPFEANTAWEWAMQHMTAQPKPIEAQPNGAGLPPRMGRAIMRALSKKKEDRPATAKEFFEIFSGVDDPNLAAPPSMANPPLPTSDGAAPRQKTEMGAPMPNFGAPPGSFEVAPTSPAGYVPGPQSPPQQQGPPAQAYTPPYGGGAAVPAGPMVTAQSRGEGGGGKGLIIAAAGVVGIITIVGVVLAFNFNKRKTPLAVPTADPTSTIVASADPTSSAGGATTSTGDVTPLGSSKATAVLTQPTATATGKPTGPGTGTTKPTGIPTLKPPSSTAPTATGPKTLSVETQNACIGAKMARDRKLPQEADLGAKCRAGGGTY